MTEKSEDVNVATMRAIRQEEFGGPEVLHEATVAKPEPDVGEIRIAIKVAGVNPTDVQNREGRLFLKELPLTLGWDVSGVVDAVGLGVTVHKPGDEVFGMLPYPYGVGAYADYAIAPARSFMPKPTTLDHIQAGALPLVALTAYQALLDIAKIQPGQRVLIHAAAGGVGHVAVQIAKARGAYVIGTVLGEEDAALVRSFGADEVIDNTVADFTTLDQVDVVLDTLSGAIRARSLPLVRPGGVLVTTVPSPETDQAERDAGSTVRVQSVGVELDHVGMRAIADLANCGELKPHVAATFPLAEVAKAHALLEAGKTAGKIVLTVSE